MVQPDTDPYRLYGLTVASDLTLPDLPASVDRAPDVEVRLGPVPDRLADVRFTAEGYQAGPDEVRLALEGIATFWVKNGNTIVIDPHPDAHDEVVRMFLLGSAFGALLHQRGVLPLHASAIRIEDACAAVVGPSGVGKSTLAAAFAAAGHPLVTDDVLVVEAGDGDTATCAPGPPQLKLWADSARRLGIETTGLRQLQGLRRKFAVPVEGTDAERPHRLTHVYALDVTDDVVPSLEPIAGAAKVVALMENTYRFHYLEGLARRPGHFDLCATLARSIEMKRVRRPRSQFVLEGLVQLIERDLSTTSGIDRRHVAHP